MPPPWKALKLFLVSAGFEDLQITNLLVAGTAKEQLWDQIAGSAEAFDAAIAILGSPAEEDRKTRRSCGVARPRRGDERRGRGVEEDDRKRRYDCGAQGAGTPRSLAGLKIDKARSQKIVTLLLRDKALIKISDQ